MAAFGEQNLTRKSLLEFAQSQARYWPNGAVNKIYPTGLGALDINEFTEIYPEWVWQYWLHTGDRGLLAAVYPVLDRLAGYVHRAVAPGTGLVTYLPATNVYYDLPGGHPAQRARRQRLPAGRRRGRGAGPAGWRGGAPTRAGIGADGRRQPAPDPLRRDLRRRAGGRRHATRRRRRRRPTPPPPSTGSCRPAAWAPWPATWPPGHAGPAPDRRRGAAAPWPWPAGTTTS